MQTENHVGQIPIFDSYTPDTDACIYERFSKDSTICARGKIINELCTQTGWRILKGRTQGNCLGEYTCHTPLGSSDVDYIYVTENLLSNVLFFKVHNYLADLSDHCQISVMLNINCILSDNFNESNLNKAPVKYIWNQEAANRFQETL